MIKFKKDAIILTNISMQKPKYWPSTTLALEKALLLKKAARRERSSKLVAMKADTDMVSSINVSTSLMWWGIILNF